MSSAGQMSTLSCSDRLYTLNGSVELIGSGGSKAVIGCNKQDGGANTQGALRRAKLHFVAARAGLRIYFFNIDFRYIDITLSGFSTKARKCSFVETKTRVESTDISNSIAVDLSQSLWRGHTSCDKDLCFPSDEFKVSGDITRIYMSDNTFRQTSVAMSLTAESRVVFERNVIMGSPEQHPVQSGLSLIIAPGVLEASVIVRHCIFRDQYNWNPIDGLMNLFSATLLMRVQVGLYR